MTQNTGIIDAILASVSFWPLLIIKSVVRVSQHVLFTHELLVKVVGSCQGFCKVPL